jgi:hypothetical protein
MMLRASADLVAFSHFRRPSWLARAACLLAGLGVLAALLVPGSAEARMARRAGGYDGIWNVVFATSAGNCSSGYSVPFEVRGHRVSSAGGGKVTGGVGRGGAVAVQIKVGASVASGNGRLAGQIGTGRWSGLIAGDRCSGTWQATRS